MKNKVIQSLDNESDIDITPMLDVVFIMLIFFIVTASFVKEQGIGVFTSPNIADSVPTSKPIVLSINSDNQISIEGRAIDARSIESVIVRMKAERPDASVIVRVSGAANTKTVISAVDGIRSADILYPSVTVVGAG